MIVVYGGSFDPPHLGHFRIVETILSRITSVSKIWIVPNAISPFKKSKSLSADDIWELCKLTFQSLLGQRVLLSDVEIKAQKISYTFDTVAKIKENHPKETIGLCIGEDSLTGLHQWYRFEELNSILSSFFVLRRNTPSPLPLTFPSLEIQNKSEVLDNELWDISSSRIRNDRDLEYAKQWMNPNALRYLADKGWF